MKILIFILSLELISSEPISTTPPPKPHPKGEGKQWVLLVAGSNSWFNYRHQADICHAYHVVSSHGIPDDQIVVMMYDDIAYNKYNPTPGVIINSPGGPNVYPGVPKDYIGKDVTPENFLKVLKGDEEGMKGVGSGKVIKSGPNDNIFVYFADHGAPGLLAFPNGTVLHTKPFNIAILKMYLAKKYKQMVFYIEACESGSMFYKQLPNYINVYATTAANHSESSYAFYLDKDLKTFLGDLYSIRWLEDSDKENLQMETLSEQFGVVKRETNMSHPQVFGDMKMGREPVSRFQGRSLPSKPHGIPLSQKLRSDATTAIPSGDVILTILKKRVEWAKTKEELEQAVLELENHIKDRRLVEGTMKAIVSMASTSTSQAIKMIKTRAELTDLDCYAPLVEHFRTKCFSFNEHEYALRHMYVLANLCEERIPPKRIHSALESICS